MMETYRTSDNGGVAYIVEIDFPSLLVYTTKHNGHYWVKDTLIRQYSRCAYFVGQSFENEVTAFNRTYGPSYNGNSILVRLSDNRYVYIGRTIIEFTTFGRIVEYHSPVDWCLCPAPYAIDDLGNTYLITEDVIIRDVPSGVHPYTHYYELSQITTDMGSVPPRPPKKTFERIQHWFINGREATMTYRPHPKAEYDRLTAGYEGRMSISKKNGTRTRIRLTRNGYVRLMNRFECANNIRVLDGKTLHKPE